MSGIRASVTVTGVGAAAAPPDVAVVVVGVECVARHTVEALSNASTAIGAMREVAIAAGVSAADVATTTSQLWPELDRDGRPGGFRAQLSLTIRVGDLASASELVPALIAAGGDQARLHSTSLEHSDPAALAAAARQAAFADAHDRAQQYADLAGRALGEVVAVHESPRDAGVPRFAAKGLTAMAASMPIEPGMGEVTASVTVRWRLV